MAKGSQVEQIDSLLCEGEIEGYTLGGHAREQTFVDGPMHPTNDVMSQM